MDECVQLKTAFPIWCSLVKSASLCLLVSDFSLHSVLKATWSSAFFEFSFDLNYLFLDPYFCLPHA